MVEFAPSTGGLALWVQHADSDDVSAPVVATDGHTVFYGAGFERLKREQQVGWVAHEVLHIALRHAQRYTDLQRLLGDADLQLYTVCADAIVNSALGHLGWLQLPADAVALDRLLASTLGVQQSVEKSLLEWDVETLYRAIDDRRPPKSGGGKKQAQRGGQGQSLDASAAPAREDGPRAARTRELGAGSVADLKPSAGQASRPEDDAEAAREWSERLLRAHASDGEFSMLRALVADLPKSRTPWEQVLRVQLARGLSKQPGLSWSRPSRSYIANQGRAGPRHRMPWEPGTSASRLVPRLVVVVDVSGSVEAPLLQRFATEIEALSRRLEAELVLVIGDDQVRRVAVFEPGRSDLRSVEFHGGGGTDFTPLLQEADWHRPDIGVVLTDLDGPARFRPAWPLLWAVPEKFASTVPPFGRVLALR